MAFYGGYLEQPSVNRMNSRHIIHAVAASEFGNEMKLNDGGNIVSTEPATSLTLDRGVGLPSAVKLGK